MRKEKILEILENAKDGNGAVPMRLVRTAFDELPEPCEDTISRQAAIDALDVLCQEHRYRIPGKRETYSEYNEAWQDALDRAEGLIFNLPPIQPEPQVGHWIEGRTYRGVIECNCSECSQLMTTAATVRMNFCPNCGAKMTISK